MSLTDSYSGAPRVTRRGLLKSAISASAAFALPATEALAAPAGGSKLWSIGCFNRPWRPLSYNDALDGMHAAGFSQIGLLGDHAGEPFTSPDATGQYLAELRKRIETRKLSLETAWLKTDSRQSV